MLIIFGTLVLDTIHTPSTVNKEILGGSCSYAALASSLFTKTHLVAVVGSDFPQAHIDTLAQRMDVKGLTIMQGRTFRYEARYENDFESRVDMVVEPNITADFKPVLTQEYMESDYVYLANSDPAQQIALLEQLGDTKMVMCDTITHWIETKRNDVIRLLGMVDATIINDVEARVLTGKRNLWDCAHIMMEWGSPSVIIKKAEHGSILFHEEEAYSLPAFPLSRVLDPTGAGDSFAGAVMGYMDSTGSTGPEGLRKACLYGNVLGSFVVEKYGMEGILSLTRDMIRERAQAYSDMLCVKV